MSSSVCSDKFFNSEILTSLFAIDIIVTTVCFQITLDIENIVSSTGNDLSIIHSKASANRFFGKISQPLCQIAIIIVWKLIDISKIAEGSPVHSEIKWILNLSSWPSKVIIFINISQIFGTSSIFFVCSQRTTTKIPHLIKRNIPIIVISTNIQGDSHMIPFQLHFLIEFLFHHSIECHQQWFKILVDIANQQIIQRSHFAQV